MSTSSRPDVGVVGLGAWGTALAHHLSRKGLAVTGWTRSPEIAASITASGHHPHLFTGQSFGAKFRATTGWEGLQGIGCLVLALPSKALSHVGLQVANSGASWIVSAAKGIEPTSKKSPLAFLRDTLAVPERSLCVISGPSFAHDLVAGRPLSLVAASSDNECSAGVAKLFSSSSVRVYMSSDTIGVELGGIVKNVIAIAAGVSDALGFGPSARAALLTRGLSEMTRLLTAVGADMRTVVGLSGLGDLLMTASDDASRNRTVGLRLGRGETLSHIIETLGATAEGVTTAPLVLERATALGIEVPITQQVVRLLNGEISAEGLARELLNRPLRSEF